MADTLNQKTLNTRIKLKYDSYENWSTNNPELLAGEVALVYVPADKVAEVGEHNLTGTTPPHVLMKVGDGTSKFNSLKYVSALAADVNSYAKMKATDFEAQVKALANAQVSESIKANADAIDALEALVGTESVTTQIANAIAALDLANTYAAKEHTHTKDEITDFAHTHTKSEITDFAHTHTAAEITDLDSTIKGYDYATKDELNNVDAKFADYKKAADQKLIDDEQDRRLGVIEGDYLKAADKTELQGNIAKKLDANGLVSNSDGLVAMKENADGTIIASSLLNTGAITVAKIDPNNQENNQIVGVSYKGLVTSDSEMNEYVIQVPVATNGTIALVSDVEAATGEVEGLIAAEKERAEGIEGGLRTDVDAIKGDYLKAADKEALQTQINTIMNNPDAEGAINSINEFTQYINEHGEIAEGFRTDIDKNKEDIAAINNSETGILKQAKDYADGLAGNYAEAEHDHVVADITDFETVVEARITAKGYATTGYVDQAKEDAKSHANGLNTAMDNRVKVLEGINHDAYKAADEQVLKDAKEYADGKDSAMDTRVKAVEEQAETNKQNIALHNQQYVTLNETVTGHNNFLKDSLGAGSLGTVIDAAISGKADKSEVTTVANNLANVKATADTAVQTVTADTGLKATKAGTDVAISIDEAITFVLDCGTSTI